MHFGAVSRSRTAGGRGRRVRRRSDAGGTSTVPARPLGTSTFNDTSGTVPTSSHTRGGNGWKTWTVRRGHADPRPHRGDSVSSATTSWTSDDTGDRSHGRCSTTSNGRRATRYDGCVDWHGTYGSNRPSTSSTSCTWSATTVYQSGSCDRPLRDLGGNSWTWPTTGRAPDTGSCGSSTGGRTCRYGVTRSLPGSGDGAPDSPHRGTWGWGDCSGRRRSVLGTGVGDSSGGS